MKLWTSSTISNLGDGMRFAAFPLLAASLTDQPGEVGLLFTALTLPAVLFSLQAGALLDRLDRRRVLGWVNLAQGVVIAALAGAVATGHASLWLLYAVAFAVGTAEAFVDTGVVTVTPDLVTADRLEDANGRIEAAATGAKDFVGAFLGAVLFALATPTPFVADAVLTALAAFLALRLRPRPQSSSASPTRVRTAIAEGLRYVWNVPSLRALAAVLVAVAFFDMAWFAVFVLYATDILGLGEVGFGALLAVGAVGSITGGVLAPRMMRLLGAGRTVGLTAAACAVTQGVLGATSSLFVAVPTLVVNSGSITAFVVAALTLRQAATPAQLLGRVNGTFRFLSFGAIAAGSAGGGALAQLIDLRAPFLLGVPAILLVALLAARSLPGETGTEHAGSR